MTEAPRSSVTNKPMVRDMRPMELSYKGQSVTIQMPGWYCQDFTESVHTGEDMRVSDDAVRALQIRVEKLLPPEKIKRIRNKLGLTQREASAVIGGGGENAFQKYESGEVVLSKGMKLFARPRKAPRGNSVLKESAA